MRCIKSGIFALVLLGLGGCRGINERPNENYMVNATIDSDIHGFTDLSTFYIDRITDSGLKDLIIHHWREKLNLPAKDYFFSVSRLGFPDSASKEVLIEDNKLSQQLAPGSFDLSKCKNLLGFGMEIAKDYAVKYEVYDVSQKCNYKYYLMASLTRHIPIENSAVPGRTGEEAMFYYKYY